MLLADFGVRIRFPFTVHNLMRLSSRTFAREFVELRPERKADSPAVRPGPGWGRVETELSSQPTQPCKFCFANSNTTCQFSIINSQFSEHTNTKSLLDLPSLCLVDVYTIVKESSLNKTLLRELTESTVQTIEKILRITSYDSENPFVHK